jgi:hypothetical protein
MDSAFLRNRYCEFIMDGPCDFVIEKKGKMIYKHIKRTCSLLQFPDAEKRALYSYASTSRMVKRVAFLAGPTLAATESTTTIANHRTTPTGSNVKSAAAPNKE